MTKKQVFRTSSFISAFCGSKTESRNAKFETFFRIKKNKKQHLNYGLEPNNHDFRGSLFPTETDKETKNSYDSRNRIIFFVSNQELKKLIFVSLFEAES